jgi:hypothetical protein
VGLAGALDGDRDGREVGAPALGLERALAGRDLRAVVAQARPQARDLAVGGRPAQRAQQRPALGARVGELVGRRGDLRGDVGGGLAQRPDVGELGQARERLVQPRRRDPQRERRLAAAVAGRDVRALDVAAGGLGLADHAVGRRLDVSGRGRQRQLGGTLHLARRRGGRGGGQGRGGGGGRGLGLRGAGGRRGAVARGVLARRRLRGDGRRAPARRRGVVARPAATGHDHQRHQRGGQRADHRGHEDLRRAQPLVPARAPRPRGREARVDARVERRQERGAGLGALVTHVGDEHGELRIGGRLAGQRGVELAQAVDHVGVGQGVTTAHGRPSSVG